MPTSVALSQFSDNSDTDYQGSEREDCGEMPSVGSQRGDGSNMTQSRAARFSTKRKKISEVDDEALYSEVIQTIHEGADLETLTLKHCKAYIRAHGMRLTGAKAILLARIKEHLELKAGGLEAKYPRSSFVIRCKGDACCGDVVLFHQTVYNKYSIVTRRAQGPPLGKRLIAGRVVSESYGARKQQHTFTVPESFACAHTGSGTQFSFIMKWMVPSKIEVLWSSGVRPLTPMTQLIVKGRNLYRHNIFRQCWTNEDERKKVIQEKHARGDVARDTRALAKEKYWYKNNYVHQAKMKKRKREIASQGNTKKRRLFENGLVKDSSNKPTSKSPEVNAGQKRWKAKSRHKNGVQGAPTKKRLSEGNSVLKTMSLLRMVNVQSTSKHHMRNPKLGSVQLICCSSHCSNYASHKCSKKMCKPCCRKSGSICARHC